MVKWFARNYTLRHPWETASAAFWRKYPNPDAEHVHEADTFDRKIDTEGNLQLRRFYTLAFPLPDWLQSMAGPKYHAADIVTVNPKERSLVLKSRNLSFSSFLTIEETCTYTPDANDPQLTNYRHEARITSFLPFLAGKLETFSQNGFTQKSKKGLEAIETLCEYAKVSGLNALSSLSGTFNCFATAKPKSATIPPSSSTSTSSSSSTSS
eukprot:TRINITY_DN8863_c0_g1_i1.p1 TRINITY_DN8863_c0_g1~~TRINITY_DN8863_c0_g1_i1.p1  ORF type:complete len:210 (+),score=47.31 TRINITY_DN8863_c0_g1_i1:110-739(+)